MSKLRQLQNAQDWDGLAKVAFEQLTIVVKKRGAGNRQLAELSEEQLESLVTDVLNPYLEKPHRWTKLVAKCSGENEFVRLRGYLAKSMLHLFYKSVAIPSHQVLSRYIRETVLKAQKYGAYSFEQWGNVIVYGLPDWAGPKTQGVYQGQWTEFRDSSHCKAFDRFSAYTPTDTKGAGTSSGYFAEDISRACHRLLTIVERFASAPTLSQGAIRSGWFYLPAITDRQFESRTAEGAGDNATSRRLDAAITRDQDRPDYVLTKSDCHSAALYEPWFETLQLGQRQVLNEYTLPKLVGGDATLHTVASKLDVSHQTVKNRHDALIKSLQALLNGATEEEKLDFFAFLYSQVENASPRPLSPDSDTQGDA